MVNVLARFRVYTGGLGSNSSIGFAGSYDGVVFARYEQNPILADSGPESGADLIEYAGRLRMYYADEGDDEALAIGLALGAEP